MLPALSSSFSHLFLGVTVFARMVFHTFFLDPWDPWSDKAWSNIPAIMFDIQCKPSLSWTDKLNTNDGWGRVLAGGAFKYSWTASWRPVIIDLWFWFKPLELGVVLLPCLGALFSTIVPDIFFIDLFGLRPKKDGSQEILKELHGNHPTWFLYPRNKRQSCASSA